MKIGIISGKQKLVISPKNHCNFYLYNFTISNAILSVFDIINSAFASPARYVMEIFKRLSAIEDCETSGGIFIFNPLFEMHVSTVDATLRKLIECNESNNPFIISDEGNFPIGYYLPSSVNVNEGKYLSLLSNIDGTIDQACLMSTLLCPTYNIRLPGINLSNCDNNGFYFYDRYGDIYKWIAQTSLSKASQLLSFPPDLKIEDLYAIVDNLDMDEKKSKKRLIDAIPFRAIMPYHAGDMLFLSLAIKNTSTFVSGIIANKTYGNILKKIIPEMETVFLEANTPYRNGYDISEDKFFFDEISKQISMNSFYNYLRPMRLYNVTAFHLIDHFAFALGAEIISNNDLIYNMPPPKPFLPPVTSALKILVHHGGGWALKAYPLQLCKKLIDLLVSYGFEVAILSDSPKDFFEMDNINIVKFQDLDMLIDLLRSHHLLIGSDSFPCHYAAHVLGLPTICLFSNTKPENSDAHLSDYYKPIEKGYDCRPCSMVTTCPISNQTYCENFSDPFVILNEVLSMLKSNYAISLKEAIT